MATAPVFTENQHLQWNWGGALSGVDTVPFDPMEADEPEGPKAPEPIGQLGPEPSTQTALEEP